MRLVGWRLRWKHLSGWCGSDARLTEFRRKQVGNGVYDGVDLAANLTGKRACDDIVLFLALDDERQLTMVGGASQYLHQV